MCQSNVWQVSSLDCYSSFVGVTKTTNGDNAGDALSFEWLDAKFCDKDCVTIGLLEIM